MGDIKNKRLLYAKGFLFLFPGTVAVVLIVCRDPSWLTATLLAIAIRAFCRAYYFAFYVVEHYLDGNCKFAGLTSFLGYVLRRKRTATHPEKS